jgi:hypothetical protein
MSRAAFIGRVLEPAARALLDKGLSGVLPGTPDQRRRFGDAAEECVDAYKKLYVPAGQEHRDLDAKLLRLASAAREFAAAVTAMGDDADLVTQGQFLTLGTGEPAELERKTAEAAEWAEVTAEAADRLLDYPRAPLPRTAPATAKLIADLAEGYERIFAERPSSARLGSFMLATNEILKACNGPQIGESAAETVLSRMPFCAPPPRRGRKRREASAVK